MSEKSLVDRVDWTSTSILLVEPIRQVLLFIVKKAMK
jgi:hypothetical protein